MSTEDVVSEEKRSKPSVRKRADAIKPFQCKNLIAVLEDPEDIKNIGTVIRNVNALGVEKVYVVDPKHRLSDDWQDLRGAARAKRYIGLSRQMDVCEAL